MVYVFGLIVSCVPISIWCHWVTVDVSEIASIYSKIGGIHAVVVYKLFHSLTYYLLAVFFSCVSYAVLIHWAITYYTVFTYVMLIMLVIIIGLVGAGFYFESSTATL